MLETKLVEGINSVFEIVVKNYLNEFDYHNTSSTSRKLDRLRQIESIDLSDSFYDIVKNYGSIAKESIFVEKSELGMNTPGLLLDRLSILICKKYFSQSANQIITSNCSYFKI